MDAKDFMPEEAVIASIRRDLEAYELDRVSAHRQVLWRVPVFVGSFLIAVALLAWGLNDFADPYEQWLSTPHVFLYLGTAVGAGFLYILAIGPATSLQRGFRAHLLPIVFGFIENVRYASGATPGTFVRLPRDVVGTFNRERFDDVVSGRYNGFTFELFEANLRQKAGKSESTTFKGVIVAFETIKPFPGLVVATRKSNQVVSFFRGFFGTNTLEAVESGVGELDAEYDFRTDNPDAARPLVQGRLAKALQWLADTWPDEPARVALSGGDGFLLLPRIRNFFELPGISVPLDYEAHIRPIIADMASLLATASLVRQVYGIEDDALAR